MTDSTSTHYLIDREELLRIRQIKLLTNDRDYVFFALQIDYPAKLNPTIEVSAFCERWELSDGNFYKALGELRQKGIVVSIANSLNLQFQSS
ncbi:hypothetical protein C7B65_20780 [Phormidesmis priestleyi ULC007]|uniref:Uncharacterized protein n=1 Tax=Phormidesmis priestleyi ULC007 TaxID=1920490 RepID=A0A2T1D897_9CYAN|nr:hypothetical protein [Phormidesmis priestleyi]PSB16683.1 hypothetical protein C7B65_20780 [Phormidesmis priestleyi ULC007]PZO47616.1 MAG: hypothetical protein DCF14_19505 [Phormidesmis priestleyi]